MILHRRS
jgi:hypothetical protein